MPFVTGQVRSNRSPDEVQVKAQDRNGKWQVFTGEGLKARAFCHEIDHLDGILFTSHVVGELETQ